MTLPVALSVRTVIETYTDVLGNPNAGSATFAPVSVSSVSGQIISLAPVTVPFDGTGSISVDLPVGTDPDLSSPMYIQVTERITTASNQLGQPVSSMSRSYIIQVPSGSGSVSLSSLPDVVPTSPAMAAYLTVAVANATYALTARRTVNVLDFPGVDPTGATDSSAGIRLALAAGNEIDFPRGGTFLVSRDSGDAKAGCIALTAGKRLNLRDSTLKLANTQATSTRVLTITGAGVQVIGGTIDGNTANQSVDSNLQRHGIFGENCSGAVIDGTTIKNCAGDGISFNDSTTNATVRGCTISACDRCGFAATCQATGSSGILLTQNKISGWQPVHFEPDANIVISDVSVLDNHIAISGTDPLSVGTTSYAISITAFPGYEGTRYMISGNTIIGAVLNQRVNDCFINGNNIDASTAVNSGVMGLYGSSRVTVADNIIKAGANRAVEVAYTNSEAMNDWKVTGNTCTTTATGYVPCIRASGVNTLEISGNTVIGPGSANTNDGGIDVQFTADHDSLIINGNTVRGFLHTGIYLVPYSTFVCKVLRITNNHILDSPCVPWRGIKLAGTTTGFGKVHMSGNTVASWVDNAVETVVPVRIMLGITEFIEGVGTPESVITAMVGSEYRRTDGGTGTSHYVKESGTGNTGWVAK